MKYKESHFNKVALLASGVALTTLGFKSGAFKGISSKVIKYASNKTNEAPSIVKSFRDWANYSAKKATEEGIEKSFLRKQSYEKINVSDFFKHSKRNEFYNRVQKNVNIMFDKQRMHDTKKDLGKLEKKIKSNKDYFSSFKDTEFMDKVRQIEKAEIHLRKDGLKGSHIYNAKRQWYADVIKNAEVTAKDQAKMMKRTGHRYATFGDIFETVDGIGKNGKYKSLSLKNNSYKIDDNTIKHIVSKFTKEEMFDSAGNIKKVIDDARLMNIKLDSGLLVDAKGNISDIRGFKKSANLIMDSLSKDFQIPVLNINPFRILGVGDLSEKKVNFATLRKDSIQNIITGKAGKDGVLGTTHIFSNGSVFKFADDGSLKKIKDNMHLGRVTENTKTVSRELEGVRKMAGLKKVEYNEYTDKDGKFKNFVDKASKKLDIGFDDIDKEGYETLGTGNVLNPNTWMEKGMNFLNKKGTLRPHKGISKVNRYNEIFSNVEGGFDESFIAMNNSKKIKDIFSTDSGEVKFDPKKVSDYFSQFFASRSNLEDITTNTTNAFFLADRVNSTLSMAGLGLSTDSTTSAGGILKNLLLKRALPVYLGYNALQYGISLTERGNDEEYGGQHNIKKDVTKQLAIADLLYHKAKDFTGMTGLAKAIEKITPGLDQITELPGINLLALDRSYEEQVDYLKNGMDPIRKGRYWDSSTTAFSGGKIEYFKPSWFRRSMAEVEWSDSKYGSRNEYFANFALPTPTHPFSPIKHFLTDKYHYEEKHYRDRPYLETAPAFSNTPIIGSALGGTIGKIVKPVKKMHLGYWNGTNQELESNAPPSVFKSNRIENGGGNLSISRQGNVYSGTIGINTNNATNGSGITNPSIPFAYSTAGGGTSIVGLNTVDVDGVNQNLIQGISLAKQGPLNSDPMDITGTEYDEEIKEEPASSQSGFKYSVSDFYDSTNEFIGLYGFLASTVTGKGSDKGRYVENPSYAYSMSSQFWNMDIGGLGGEINEITRRFLHKRLKDNQLVNPVRNTMPDWMPGSEYFIDFKHGDPYVKVANGEMRLPGEGYERIWHIKEEDKFGVDSKNLYDVNSLVNNMIYKELDYKSNHNMINAQANRTKESIKTSWLNNGLAIDLDGNINNDKHLINSNYDARVKDSQSRTGQALVNLRVLDDLNNLDKEQLKKDMMEIQYQMYASGVDKGYVQYIDMNNPSNRIVKDYNYNYSVAEQVLDNLNEARSIVNEKLNSGELNPGDLYRPIDKFRILADVAPYSSQFDDLSRKISTIHLTDDEKAEVKGIRKRVQEQRNPKRLYEYKFKGVELKSQTAIVDSVFDDGTFTISGSDKRVKLAGVDIKTDQEFNYVSKKQEEFINKVLKPGSVLELSYNVNPVARLKNGKINAIVKKGGINFNKELLRQGYADENDSDDGTDMFVKTNATQRLVGSMWEGFAHKDVPIFSSKFMRVRSATEDYERSRIYSKDFADWKNPISDYLKPFVIDRNVHRGFISGIAIGSAMGSMFGKTKFGKIVGGTATALAVTGGKFFAYTKEAITGSTWRPERVIKEQEMNEYIDMLKYVKYKKLYTEYSEKAKQGVNGVNVEKLIKDEKDRGKKNKKELKEWDDFKVTSNKLSTLGIGLKLASILTGKSKEIFSTSEMLVTPLKKARDFSSVKDIIVEQFVQDANNKNEDMSNVEGKDVYDWREELSKHNEEINKEEEKAIKKKISANKNELKNDRKIIPMTGNDDVLDESYVNTIMNLSTLKNTLESTDKGYTDEDIKIQTEGTNIQLIHRKDGTIDRDNALNQVNDSIKGVTKQLNINENAVKALMYHKLSEQTMYGYDKGDSISDLMKAMPKRDRDYFRYFAEANNDEKMKILELTPKYMRRPLEASWKVEMEKKTNLEKYFSEHALPDEEWSGWNENVNLDSVKVKMIKKEGMEFSDNNIWESDVDKANGAGEIPIPKINAKAEPIVVKDTLKKMFKDGGYEQIQIDSIPSYTDNDTRLYLTRDEKAKYKKEFKKEIMKNF